MSRQYVSGVMHFNHLEDWLRSEINTGNWVLESTGLAISDQPALPGLYYHTSAQGVEPYDRWYGIKLTCVGQSVGFTVITSPVLKIYREIWYEHSGDAGRGDLYYWTPY